MDCCQCQGIESLFICARPEQGVRPGHRHHTRHEGLHTMTSIARKSIATVFAGTVLAVGIASPASAQTKQDGLVNVNVGDVTILEDVNVGVAASVAATLCDLVDVGAVNVLASNVDTASRSATICRTEAGKVKLTQN